MPRVRVQRCSRSATPAWICERWPDSGRVGVCMDSVAALIARARTHYLSPGAPLPAGPEGNDPDLTIPMDHSP